MGDPNASIPTPQPVHYRPMFGSFGGALHRRTFTFVSQAGLNAGIKERFGLAKSVTAVKNIRGVRKQHMVHNSYLPVMEIDAQTYSVRADDMSALPLPLHISLHIRLVDLSDPTIYLIDVAAGEEIPRKDGPGITKSDLFVINKTDLGPHVGANLEIMRSDTERMRTGPKGLKPFVMTNLKTLSGLTEVVSFIETRGMLRAS